MASRQVEGPARADCLLHKTVYPKQPFGSHTSLTLGCSHPINRPYAHRQGPAPRGFSLLRTKITAARVPRETVHLISAPLRLMPPESGAMILRQPRGKEGQRPRTQNRPP